MDSELRPKVSEKQSRAVYNRAGGGVIGYEDGDDSMKNLWEPSYPQSMHWEGRPSESPRFELGRVAGRKAAKGFASDAVPEEGYLKPPDGTKGWKP